MQSKGLKSLLQHHSPKASILWHSAFFIVQLSHSYMTTGKTIALTRWNFVGKVISLLFNMLSRLVIGFLPRSMRLLISWLQLPSPVILAPPKIKPLVLPPKPQVSIFFYSCPVLESPNMGFIMCVTQFFSHFFCIKHTQPYLYVSA